MNYIKYFAAQIKEEFVFYLTKLIVIFLPGRYGKLLREVKSKGYSILPSYYSESDIDTIKDEIKKTLNEREVNKIYVQEMPGSFRMKRMEKHSLSIKAMTQNFFWVLINFLYSLCNGLDNIFLMILLSSHCTFL